MTPSRPCRCSLCKFEAALQQDIAAYRSETYESLVRNAPALAQFRTPRLLVAALRKTEADANSDRIFRELREAATADESLVTNCFVLAFLPTLHAVTTQIAMHNPALHRDDIGQQALQELLHFLRSREFQSRNSYIAYSVSRTVKRQTFRWASRQITRFEKETIVAEVCAALVVDEPLERIVTLHHFLTRNLANGLLDEEDLDLLVEFKLDGNSGKELAEAKGISPNAVRQRMKRLLAKLHSLASRNSTG